MIGEGTFNTREVRDLTPDDVAKLQLVELAEHGWKVYMPGDLDTSHSPWLVDKKTGEVWLHELGEPAQGYNLGEHAIEVGKHQTWRYLTSAAASQRFDAPRDGHELEARARRSEIERERHAAEARTNLELLRSQARPVTVGDLEPSQRSTLAEAGQRIERSGGRLELVRSRLVVSLPPVATTEPSAIAALRLLYLAEPIVVEALKQKKPLPEQEILPSGAPAP